MHTCKYLAAAMLLSLTYCGDDVVTMPTSSPALDSPTHTSDLVVTSCGFAGKTGRWYADCEEHCIPDPDNIIWFLCTEKRGVIAYTHVNYWSTAVYGYNIETPQTKCANYPVRIWQLSPIRVAPTNADTGRMSADTSYWPDCTKEKMLAPYIDRNNSDRRFYDVVGEVTSPL